MQYVKSCDEKFMSVLLFVPSQVAGMCPYQMQETVQGERCLSTGVELLKKK